MTSALNVVWLLMAASFLVSHLIGDHSIFWITVWAFLTGAWTEVLATNRIR